MISDATEASAPAPVCIVPPPITTEPVKSLVVFNVSVLEPCFIKLPVPLILPEPLTRKLLALELTVTVTGETVPLNEAVVGTPTVSSNKTRSPVTNPVCWLLDRLIQLAELPLSQTPLLLLALQRRLAGGREVSLNNLDCLAFKLTLKEPLTIAVVPSHKLV